MSRDHLQEDRHNVIRSNTTNCLDQFCPEVDAIMQKPQGKGSLRALHLLLQFSVIVAFLQSSLNC